MTTLRCTAKALKRFKLTAEDSPPPSEGRLGDWYVNLLNVGHHRLVLCVSEKSLLPVLCPARKTEFPSQLYLYVAEMLLEAVGVEPDIAAREAITLKDARIGRTNDKSILGVMNDYRRMAPYHLEVESPFETALRLAEAPFNRLGFLSPIERTRQLLAVSMSRSNGGGS